MALQQETQSALELAVVVPTFKERGNVVPLLEALDRALQGIAHEVIFVDDDSPDGTAALVRQIPVASEVRRYAISVVMATHPENELAAPMTRQFVRYGSSPRGAQAIILAAKLRALECRQPQQVGTAADLAEGLERLANFVAAG